MKDSDAFPSTMRSACVGRMYGGNTTFIPLKVNSAGMIPLIFAVSILVFPGLIANFLVDVEQPDHCGTLRRALAVL